MPTYNYALSGGVNAIAGYGDRWKVGFSGTWVAGETWEVVIVSPESGDFTLGSGNLQSLAAGGTPAVACLTFKRRVYLAFLSQFNFSNNDDPTEWETQQGLLRGAGEVDYLSQFGGQDIVYGLSQLQGRLAVFARRSIQLWNVDADPNNFSLAQSLDNTGTKWSDSIQALGDSDVLYADDTGVRSLKAKELNLNAEPDDIGVQIDQLIRAALAEATNVCSIVEPVEKHYWLYADGLIYALSRHSQSKVHAWSTFVPSFQNENNTMQFVNASGQTIYFWTGQTDNFTVAQMYEVAAGDTVQFDVPFRYYWLGTDPTAPGAVVSLVDGFYGIITFNGGGVVLRPNQVQFTPLKFVVKDGKVYCRGTSSGDGQDYLFTYNAADVGSFDNALPVVELPWLDDKTPGTEKHSQGIKFAIAGAWSILGGMDPVSGGLTPIITAGDGQNPAEESDSSFDIGRIPFAQIGTHFKLLCYGSGTSTAIATLSSILFEYNRGNIE